ncbi:MAG: hypothetical protein R2746_00225 [Acidimicrobiales bacterium]
MPFQRTVPRPLHPRTVADAVVAAVDADRFEQVRPRWLRTGVVVEPWRPGSTGGVSCATGRRPLKVLVDRFSTPVDPDA